MMENKASIKPTVLIVTGYYLPSKKAGGILRYSVNLIDNLSEYFNFKIITRNRDLGDLCNFEFIKEGVWVNVDGVDVYYLSKDLETCGKLDTLIEKTKHDVLYLHSFFEPLTAKILYKRSFNKIRYKPVIVAPFGDFAWASLRQKFLKKLIYIILARTAGLYKGVIWRVSSEFEKNDVIKVMNPNKSDLLQVADLPTKLGNWKDLELSSKCLNSEVPMRIVFLSRIAREKNLNFAIRVLSNVDVLIDFDIYGPIENKEYWSECSKLFQKLPTNIKTTYCGVVDPKEVQKTFGKYDLFLFPTGGEAYGNVIAESLSVGTPVMLSKETPWRNLEYLELGWDFNLDNILDFVDAINKYAKLSSEDRNNNRINIIKKYSELINMEELINSNRDLFLQTIKSRKFV